ncbi:MULTISPECIES: D-alanine--D-alanine ligase [Nitrosomonas]|uniref:D-alanine--D-alanine ligase n=1 Tax=Nitrosomonas TaxID=914 RepID=UPI00079BBBFB|nr:MULTISPECIES: D-alanine--D-alanine ligase [Nitrosomonas]KXK47328.1 MAG: D-alanine--D-alanine ligase [Nitrosomonas europaea]MBV6389742.1 D-alanine--D-alanine ligase B [Nitrosomonas europaea]MEB2330789.1 D-alanine--D-alanine ligase [Nitrosomonas sp.]
MNTRDVGKVAVLLGGRSAEREISLRSGQAVLAALQRSRVNAHAFDPAGQPLENLLQQGFDRVFIALHGRYGEDGSVQGALELMELPYTGSGILASALAMDKWRTKMIWQAAGINTPDYVMLDASSRFRDVADRLGLPLIIKPTREGSTLGLNKVDNEQDFRSAYQAAAEYDSLVLAEQFIQGIELTAAILDDMPLPLVRIDVAEGLYDYQAKYFSESTRYTCPSGLSAALTTRIQEQALYAHRILGCTGWSRVDLILDENEQPFFLETNTSPGMTDHSLVPMAAKAAGISFDELVVQILELSCEH